MVECRVCDAHPPAGAPHKRRPTLEAILVKYFLTLNTLIEMSVSFYSFSRFASMNCYYLSFPKVYSGSGRARLLTTSAALMNSESIPAAGATDNLRVVWMKCVKDRRGEGIMA